MTMDEMTSAFARLHTASRNTPPSDAEARKETLGRLADMVRANADAFITAISDDFGGRSPDETRILEIVPTLRAIQHARRHVRRWMRDERRAIDVLFQPARGYVRYEPLGVVGVISPWNYPLLLALAPLTDALAAGNRAMLKPSELTPAFSELLARTIADTFAPDMVTVATGGVEIAQAFAGLPFDHLVFTGSTAVGRQVMRAAAENLTPVTLELGGKSPAFIAPDYPLEKAAASVAFGKFLNSGQTCIAPDYALVPRAQVHAFATAVLEAARRAYPTITGNRDYSAIISERHLSRLGAAIDAARNSGCDILSYADSGDGKIAPTVIIAPPADSVLMREEIFGPVLPVLGYDSVEHAMSIMAAQDRPLALYCFSNDRATQSEVMGGVISGGVTLNGALLHVAQDNLPFGGVGPSGMGAYHGRDGFRRFSHARSVFKVGWINVFERLGPPWGGLNSRLGKWLSR